MVTVESDNQTMLFATDSDFLKGTVELCLSHAVAARAAWSTDLISPSEIRAAARKAIVDSGIRVEIQSQARQLVSNVRADLNNN